MSAGESGRNRGSSLTARARRSVPVDEGSGRPEPGRGAGAQTPGSIIEAVWRIESAKLIASLTRIVRDVGTAEDLAHEALVAALEQWPDAGIPSNPGAWLM